MTRIPQLEQELVAAAERLSETRRPHLQFLPPIAFAMLAVAIGAVLFTLPRAQVEEREASPASAKPRKDGLPPGEPLSPAERVSARRAFRDNRLHGGVSVDPDQAYAVNAPDDERWLIVPGASGVCFMDRVDGPGGGGCVTAAAFREGGMDVFSVNRDGTVTLRGIAPPEFVRVEARLAHRIILQRQIPRGVWSITLKDPEPNGEIPQVKRAFPKIWLIRADGSEVRT